MTFSIYRHLDRHCPVCNHKLNAMMNTGDEIGAPEPGDISVCDGCGGYLIFNSEFNLTSPSDEVEFLLSLDDATRNHIIKIQAFVRRRK